MNNIDFSFLNNLCKSDLLRFSDCIVAFGDINDAEIEFAGYNENSGNAYLYLDNGISIVEGLGNNVFYIVTDSETGEEFEFDSYEEAKEKQEDLNK